MKVILETGQPNKKIIQYKIKKDTLPLFIDLQVNMILNLFLRLNFANVLRQMTKLNTLFTIILGEFNAKWKIWWASDKNMLEGARPESLTSCLRF